MSTIVISVIVLSLLFDFLNGIHDSSNVVATMISSRAFSPRVALGVTAMANFFGPFIFGVAVANTIGHEIVSAESIDTQVLIAALVSAIFWNLLTWYLGFPSSSSHALIGGLMGAIVMGAGWQAIQLGGLEKVIIALFTSPVVGYLVGFLLLRLIYALSWNASPKVNNLLRRGQIVTALALALSHGTNAAQKTMGIITLALVTGGYLTEFAVPTWVIVICAGMIGLGTAVGGWKLIKTLGGKFFKIRPVDGFASQLAGAAVIITASLVGGPVSTTQGPLGGSPRNSGCLAAYHSCDRTGWRWNLLVDWLYYPLTSKRKLLWKRALINE
jgi:PiT family inorganic phosphate transporter